jgi:DNA repair exonuclease SbcCD ATPase subunit
VRLRRVEVRAFRKIGYLVVDGLSDGLNVVVGDNEAGKSTLLAAMRAALFERHRVRGEAAEAMLPYGQSVRPEVALDFELGGKPWRLRKAFCQRPEAELVGPGGERLTGDAVEERLAELFGFTPPGKGRSKPEEHQGVHGLLWVEQGASHRALGVGAGREAVAAALEAEVGQVVGGERGRALLAAAEERRDAFWGKNDKPVGAYRVLLGEVEELAKRKAELEAQLANHDAKVAELGAKQEALARHAREDRLNLALRELASAKEACLETQRLEDALNGAGERRRRERVVRDAAAERRRAREGLVRKMDEARASLARTEEAAEEARGYLAGEEGRARSAEDRLERARAALRETEERVRVIELAIERQAAVARLSKLEEQLSAAEAAEATRREALAAAAAVPIGDKDVGELEALQAALDRARARLDAAGVRIAFLPEGERWVSVDGAPHDQAVPLRLSRDAELRLEGYGRLVVHPGGGIGELARQAAEAARALERGLERHGFPGVAEAKTALRAKAEARREAETQGRIVAAIAPEGMESLRQAIGRERAVSAPPAPEAVAAAACATEAELDEAKRTQDSAAEAVRTGEAAAKTARTAHAAVDRETATLNERAAAAKREHDAAVRELSAARAQAADEQLAEALEKAEAALGLAERAEAAARAALARADPELAALRLKRAEGAERAIRADLERLTRDTRDLEVELRALGRDGIGEQLAEVEGRRGLKRRQAAARDLEAAAARLLCGTLAEAQREAKDRWLAPVRRRVAPYLRLIRSEGDVVLNEDTFEIEDLVRGDVKEPFQALSVGAREQVAVITRLALADALRVSGRPSAVILDDALVNADEARLERMHLVLHKAAEALQILVLTCRERDFARLGAPIHRVG